VSTQGDSVEEVIASEVISSKKSYSGSSLEQWALWT